MRLRQFLTNRTDLTVRVTDDPQFANCVRKTLANEPKHHTSKVSVDRVDA
jgi:hypothetical protein